MTILDRQFVAIGLAPIQQGDRFGTSALTFLAKMTISFAHAGPGMMADLNNEGQYVNPTLASTNFLYMIDFPIPSNHFLLGLVGLPKQWWMEVQRVLFEDTPEVSWNQIVAKHSPAHLEWRNVLNFQYFLRKHLPKIAWKQSLKTTSLVATPFTWPRLRKPSAPELNLISLNPVWKHSHP